MSAGGAGENASSVSTTNSLGTGRAGGPGSLVSAGGAGENAGSVSIANSLGTGGAGGPCILVSAGGEGGNASSVSTTNSVGTGRAGGPGSLVSAGGEGENASSVSTTNSVGIGRAEGPGCFVSVDSVGVTKDHVGDDMSWAGGPGDQLYIMSTVNTDNSSELVHQFNKDETSERKCFLNTYGADTKGRHRTQIFPRSSSLSSLSPFFDEENKVIPVGGRLTNSSYSIARKFPILIPRKSPITEMLIREAHEINLHGGPQLTLYTLRRTIWIPGGLSVVKGVLYRCKPCIRFDAKLLQPQMGDLPREKFEPSFAFSHCGFDYCEPFYTKNGTRKLLKTYVAIFICFSTKAVHIEPVMSLTKDDCLAAIKSFVSRRGLPDEIYSDNSTTFIGTKGELEFRQALATHEFEDLITTFGKENKITWFTIPPRTPNFGGLWEAAVKSLKRHMYRSIGRTKLFFEDFTTLLTQIEAILISWPITCVSNDPNDAIALTPGHFLIGRPITALAEPKTTGKETISLTRQKKRMDNLIRDFRKKWSTEYLSNLQQWKKWQMGQPNIDINDVVIIKEENTPPPMWPMGRKTKVFDGNDKISRVVELKTSSGLFIRPVNKLALLTKDDIDMPSLRSDKENDTDEE